MDKLTILPDDSALPNTTIACGQDAVLFENGVEDGKVYGFLVEAFAPGDPDYRWGARCTASATPGVTTLASCSALTDLGSVQIDVATLLADSLLTCDPSAPETKLTLDVSFDDGDTPVSASGLACSQDVILAPLSRGSHSGQVTVRGVGGSFQGHALCFASVVPATTTTATCVAD